MLKIIQTVFQKKLQRNIFFSLLAFLIFFISKDFGMFDDDILFGTKMGNQLYYNSIFNWSMPVSFDPGHPPFLASILTIFWKIFGHNLWATHLAMVPFTIGFFIQLFKFISYFVKDFKLQFFAFILIIVDPTLSTCLVLVNIEVVTLFFFFLAVVSILHNKTKFKFIGLLFLSIVSFRSMMLFAGVCLFEILNQKFLNKQNLKNVITKKFFFTYFFASLPAFIYVGWRFLTKGWLQTHADSPWESMWHFTDFNYFIRNCIVLIWRYLDFGRIFIIFFIVLSCIAFGKKILLDSKVLKIPLLAFTSVFFIISTILVVTNTVGIRYFITSYICLNFFSFLILINFYRRKKLIFTLLFLGLLTGNLWVYPKPISTAYRATLAHTPYHSLRIKAIDYLNKNHIPIEQVASFFPNYTTLDLIDLKGDKRAFSKFNGKNNYVFYATVYNLSDKELKTLQNNYTILKEFNNFNICIKIYTLKK